MRIYAIWIMLILAGGQFSCKAGSKQTFVKGSKERMISLSTLYGPKVIFILQSKDILKFNKYEVVKEIGKFPNNYAAGLSDSLKADLNDMFVYQDLSAVGNRTISGILDSWVARELLEEGKAEIFLNNHQTITRLRYDVTRDALGGRQGTFYGNGDRVVYSCIIALGE
jgi:hypothetical protein